MINHCNTADTALGPLGFKVKESQSSRIGSDFQLSHILSFLLTLAIAAYSYLLLIRINQVCDIIHFQAQVPFVLGPYVSMEMWFNNRFGLPLAQISAQSTELLLGPGEVMRTPLTPGQRPVQ